MLTYWLSPTVASRPAAAYALQVLLDGIGEAARPVDDPGEAHLAYAPERPLALAPQAVWLRADEVPDWNAPRARLGRLEGLVLPYQRRAPEPAASAFDVRADLLYATYALATGALEAAQPSNAWGVPWAEAEPLRPLYARPVVSACANLLAERLRRSLGSAWHPVPRWPGGATSALVLSHDVDAPFSRPSMAFYARRFRRDLVRRDARGLARGTAGWLRTAVARALGRVPRTEHDPNFGFDAWRALQARLGTHAAFYVAVTTAADPEGDPHDVAYDAAHPAMVRAMREAVDAGWEVGLHASIRAWQTPGRLAAEKARLEALLGGRRIVGVRHHHWALDPRQPARTLRAHAEAGFTYDASFGLNDAPGFRRGLAWPFTPFDPERGEPLPLLSVPPTLMDGGIFYRDVAPSEGARQIRAHLHETMEQGGAAVLDWHLEQMNPARLHGAGPVLAEVLLGLAADSSIHWASPAELAAWWRTRRRRIAARARRPVVRLRPGRAPAHRLGS